MADADLHVHLPATSFVSLAEFEEWLRTMQPRLDARYAFERDLASADPEFSRDGTCAPCLRRMRFTCRTEGGEATEDGRRIPNWREQMTCDCEDHLNNRSRALLHYLDAEAGLPAWSRVLLFGRPAATDRRIEARAGETCRIRCLALGWTKEGTRAYRIQAASGAFHLVVSSDYLHQVPSLRTALAELNRVLAPGGQFVFTVPFHYRAPRSVATWNNPSEAVRPPREISGEAYALGWDLLEWLREAGFADARAHLYWSDELGYCGFGNFIFSATN
ncbi:MAG: methyltransferase domain-containing protein [Nevskia sp.]|nr:methyltransferase domain-containing protein [Nevskia sp.]